MRLIDADALMKHADLKEWGLTKALWINAEVFRNAPTVDAVEVVRCKDCKHAEFSEAGMTYCPGIIGSWVEDDWFCADGERREEG